MTFCVNINFICIHIDNLYSAGHYLTSEFSYKQMMNPSDWIKAATLVTQHKQEAAMVGTDQLSSMPLSEIAMDDSGPPVVQYGMHRPVAASTPTGTDVHVHSSQQEDSYQQIIPGIPQGSLYPTLSSLSSEAVTSNDEVQSLQDKVSKGLDTYLQDAEQCHALELNYFDDTTRPTSVEPMSEAAEQTNKSSSIICLQPSKHLWKRQYQQQTYQSL